MRKRILFTVICLIATLFLFLNGFGLWQFLQNYIHRQEEKVREWQREHQQFDDDVALVTSTSRPRQLETEWVTVPVKVPDTTTVPSTTTTTIYVPPPTTTTIRTTRIRITTSTYTPPTAPPTTSTSTTTTSTTAAPTTTTTMSTTPSTTTSTTTTTTPIPTTTSSSTTTTTSPPTTTTTTEAPTTRIRTWTHPTRRPPTYDPDRHRYGQDRFQHHHQHHHHTSTTSTTTTEAPTTTTVTPGTTTRIRVTTPRYISTSSNSVYERITIPASSSYRNPYIHKIEVTSSTYRTPGLSSSTTSSHHHHHQHHHHNRTHIEIHSHRHHIPYPQFPYPVIPNVLYSTTTTSTSTTTTTTEAPSTTVTPEETTSHHHHHHHHHHEHHHHHHSSTPKPTTTTARQSELDRWGFVESVEEVASEEESTTSTSTSSTTTTTTTTTPSTTTTAAPAPRPVDPRGRHRQPEPPQPPVKRVEREATLVTGFLDIGRGEWGIYRRPLEIYHQFMETLLNLDNNFVIFTDDSTYDFVIKTRTKLGLIEKTKVYKITLNDLPLYSYINEAKKIIDDELKNDTFYKTVDMDMRTHPEAISAEYNIVVNSKTYFLHNVTMENPFDSEHFIWLDAGYGHANENYFPYSYKWRPALPDGKITLIKIAPWFDLASDYDLKKMYRKNVAIMSGGFIGGDKHSIGQLHSIIHRKFIQLIYQNHIDDDQTLLTLAYNSYPHLFHVVLGGWFDAFRLFDVNPEVQLG